VAVRWYLRYCLSYRDVEEQLAESGVEVDHVTVYRLVQRLTPLLAEAARPCRHMPGDRWFVDETAVGGETTTGERGSMAVGSTRPRVTTTSRSSTSSGPPSGSTAHDRPVYGFSDSNVRPESASTARPPMSIRNRSMG
jgi:hypothetical protein